jgi:hypothetical protein
MEKGSELNNSMMEKILESGRRGSKKNSRLFLYANKKGDCARSIPGLKEGAVYVPFRYLPFWCDGDE